MNKLLSLLILCLFMPVLSLAGDSCKQSTLPEESILSHDLKEALNKKYPRLSNLISERHLQRFISQGSRTYKDLLEEDFSCNGNLCTLRFNNRFIETILHYEVFPLRKGGQRLEFRVEHFSLKDPETNAPLEQGARPDNLNFHFK